MTPSTSLKEWWGMFVDLSDVEDVPLEKPNKDVVPSKKERHRHHHRHRIYHGDTEEMDYVRHDHRKMTEEEDYERAGTEFGAYS